MIYVLKLLFQKNQKKFVVKQYKFVDPNLKATSKLPFVRNRVGNIFTFEIIAKCETKCVENTFSV